PRPSRDCNAHGLWSGAHEDANRGRTMDGAWVDRVRTAHPGRRHRTLFLSDVHLATRACRAHALLDFLRHNEAGTIYLVGDIIDFWRMKRGAVWPQPHSDVVRALLQKMCNGAR